MTDIDICNLAISLAGSTDLIQDFEEEQTTARMSKLWYVNTRDSLLRKFSWSFAHATVALAKIGDPVYPFTYSYAVPVDWLRTYWLTAEPSPVPLTVPLFPIDNLIAMSPFDVAMEQYAMTSDVAQTSRRVSVSVDPAYMTYVRKITNVDLFDESFKQALIYSIAAAICYPVTTKASRAKELAAAAAQMLEDAMSDEINEKGLSLNDFIPEAILER